MPRGPLWSRLAGGTGQDVAQAIGVDPAGNVTIGTDIKGTVDFGTGPLSGGIVLATFTPSGAPTWVEHIVGSWVEVTTALAVRNGKVLLGGNSPYAPFDPGTEMLPIGGFVAQYQP